MEQLLRLMQDASNQFQCHHFQTSLSLYVRCIQKCQDQKLPLFILHNLQSSEAALRALLGQQDVALSILNSVLKQNNHHYLCLLRRSQIYKKQNKLKKALKDLDILSMYAPDNMQLSAMKFQINSLLHRKGNSSSQEENSSENEIYDEKYLNFANLKRIDRTSLSIIIPKGRQSRVTISGDRSFCYDSEGNSEYSRQSTILAPHFIRKKFIQIEDQLQKAELEESTQNGPVITIKVPINKKKSILRNRSSKIYIEQGKSQNLISTQEGKKLIEKLQNIDGHCLYSDKGSSIDQRQVQFQKDSYQFIHPFKSTTQSTPDSRRKSCLKRSSFGNIGQTKQKQVVKKVSKFSNLSRNSIDGKFIKSSKIQDQVSINKKDKQNIPQKRQHQSGDESEEGSQHNIFGSRKLDIQKQLRQNFGFRSDQIIQIQDAKKSEKKERKRSSILKKASVVIKKEDSKKKKASVFFHEAEQKTEDKPSKKSVMFRTC